MIEIEMSADVRNFEPKIMGPFSLRQLICVGIGAAIAVPILLLSFIPIEARCILAIVLSVPAFACGFLKLYGMNAEVFFLKVIIPLYLNPMKRKYVTELSFEEELKKREPVVKKKEKKMKYHIRPRR